MKKLLIKHQISNTLPCGGRDSIRPKKPSYTEAAELHVLGVSPDYQGKGIARQLIHEALCLCKENGKKVLRLDVIGTNTVAKKLYPSQGFVFCDTGHLSIRGYEDMEFLFYEQKIE